MRERDVELHLLRRVAALGGQVRKVCWIGRANAPDRLVLLPGRAFLVELKRPGRGATPAQAREHARLRSAGLRVDVLNSYESVDAALLA